ncbi:MAG: TauD/TfdA family dioxygenase, partial [Gammaproteobacteria bacterium]|nr:TauD/TfdA family dioxygenase [Gammaproteobacteria bacterium]
MAAEFQLQPLDGNFGLVARDIDLPTLSDAGLKTLLLALYENRFVVVETGGLDRSDFVAFARRVGQPIRLSGHEEFPEVARITNMGADTLSARKGAAHWHTDQSFREELSSVTMLYSVQAPKRGGETRFCDMAAAYRALPEGRKSEIADLMVEHRHGVSIA